MNNKNKIKKEKGPNENSGFLYLSGGVSSPKMKQNESSATAPFIYIEQTKIAIQLGISMKALHRIIYKSGIESPKYFKLIDNKRHYKLEDILDAIKKGKNG